MTLIQIGALALLGCCTGFAAGLLGIGGGMILVPFLSFLFTMYGFDSSVVVHIAIARPWQQYYSHPYLPLELTTNGALFAGTSS